MLIYECCDFFSWSFMRDSYCSWSVVSFGAMCFLTCWKDTYKIPPCYQKLRKLSEISFSYPKKRCQNVQSTCCNLWNECTSVSTYCLSRRVHYACSLRNLSICWVLQKVEERIKIPGNWSLHHPLLILTSFASKHMAAKNVNEMKNDEAVNFVKS